MFKKCQLVFGSRKKASIFSVMGLGEWHWREREKENRKLSRRGWSIGLFIVFVTSALVYTYTKS